MSILTGPPLPYPDQRENPLIAYVFDVSAAYLRTACADPASVISASKVAVASMVSAHASGVLALAEVEAAAAVPGVQNVRNVTIDANPADLPGFVATVAPVVPNLISVTVGTIV